jgi:transcription elongation factor GreB
MPSPESTREKTSPYITQQGYLLLQQESNGLWLRRRDVTRHLAAAAAEGDRSENAEYIYRKKELREIDRRIRYLQKRLPQLKIVRAAPDNRKQVFFGARVTLENDRGETVIYRIVGADEYGRDKSYISVDSPLAKALLKKKLDEEVRVETPKGLRHYSIVAIAYETD